MLLLGLGLMGIGMGEEEITEISRQALTKGVDKTECGLWNIEASSHVLMEGGEEGRRNRSPEIGKKNERNSHGRE